LSGFAKIVLLLASLGLVTLAVVQLTARGRERFSVEACHDSVLLMSRSAQFVGNPTCDTVPMGDLSGELRGSPEERQRLMVERVSRAMADCWYEWGEGAEQPWKGPLLDARRSVCFVCSTFRMPEDGALSAVDFLQYASTAKYHTALGDVPYREFLGAGVFTVGSESVPFVRTLSRAQVTPPIGGEGPTGAELNYLGADPLPVLEKGQDYAVVFWNLPGSRWSQVSGVRGPYQLALDWVASAAGVEGDKRDSFVFVTPDEKVSKSCDVVLRTV
jgi:hypothetical protein